MKDLRTFHNALSLGGGNRFFLIAILSSLLILSNLSAITLQEICTNPSNCTINTPQSEITNSTDFSTTSKITIRTQIQSFINHSTIKAQEISVENTNNYIANFYNYGRIETTSTQGSLTTTSVYNGSGYRNIYNYGYISSYVHLSQNENIATNITNYGEMGGVVQSSSANKAITIDNRGTINLFQFQINNQTKKIHFKNIRSLTLQNYAMKIKESQAIFNGFDGNATDNSHLVVDNVMSVNFADANAKMILDFGGDFEVGKGYSLNKLIVDTSGANMLGVDFSRLVPYSDIYYLTQQGENFIVNLKTESSTIGNLYKSNIRTMNNFLTISNSMIYPHKYSAKRNANKRRVIRRVKKTANLFNDSWIASGNALAMTSEADSSLQNDSSVPFASLRENERSEFSWQSKSHDFNQPQITMNQERINNLDSWIASSATLPRNDEFLESLESLESNESFAYKSDLSDYYANNATNPNSSNQTTTRRRITTTNQTNPISNPNANRNPQITQSDKYYFILTPFVNHNLFFESGRYNLSGLEYGFLTAFSGKITPSNTLGAHFMMSYGSLGDLKDKNFNITNLNLNIGLNYKFDMIWDMYIKARGDFYYFLNQVKTLTIFEAIKPNNLGFGLSVAYGKDFNFGSGGMLGVELGIDYKALQSSNISLQNSADRSVSEIYQKSLYNLIYVDLGLNYAKYFNTSVGLWGLNANMGIKGNVSANKLAKSQIRLNALNRSVDMTLDNDKVLGYINLSGSYVLNAKNFNMEFSIAYYGNYGDRVISNGGGFEWRVVW